MRAACAALLLSAACPWPDGAEIRAPDHYRPGEPFELRARVSLGRAGAPVSGRGHLALRLPPDWKARGIYRLEGRAFELQPAPVVAALYGRGWIAFVSHLHTDLPADAEVSVVLRVEPAGAAAGEVEIAIGAGMAPRYPGSGPSRARRRLRLRAPAP